MRGVLPIYSYSKKSVGLEPITQQVQTIVIILLNPIQALEFSKKLATLLEHAEEWFPILKVSVVATKNFSSIKENASQYCEAVKMV